MKVTVKKCFKITGIGYVVEIQHNENGLPRGLKLISDEGEIWEVKYRVIFSHCENHKFFHNETQSISLLKFANEEDCKKSIEKIEESEKINIFQYILHNSLNAELCEEEILQIIKGIES